MDNTREINGMFGKIELINGGNGISPDDGRFLPDLHYAIYSTYKNLCYGHCMPAEAIVRAHALAEHVFSGLADAHLLEEFASHARDDMKNGYSGDDDDYFYGVARWLHRIDMSEFRNNVADTSMLFAEANGREPERPTYPEQPADPQTVDIDSDPIDRIFGQLDALMGGDTYEALRRIRPLADGICAGLAPRGLMESLANLDEGGIGRAARAIAECADGKNLMGKILESAGIEPMAEEGHRAGVAPQGAGSPEPSPEIRGAQATGDAGQARPESERDLYGLYSAYEGKGIDLRALDKSIYYLFAELEYAMKPEEAALVTCRIVEYISSGAAPAEFVGKLADIAISEDNGEIERRTYNDDPDREAKRNPYEDFNNDLSRSGIIPYDYAGNDRNLSGWGHIAEIAKIAEEATGTKISEATAEQRLSSHKTYHEKEKGCTILEGSKYNAFTGLLHSVRHGDFKSDKTLMSFSDALLKLKPLAEYCCSGQCDPELYGRLSQYFGPDAEKGKVINDPAYKEVVRLFSESGATDPTIRRADACLGIPGIGRNLREAWADMDDKRNPQKTDIFKGYAPSVTDEVRSGAEKFIEDLYKKVLSDYACDTHASLIVCPLAEYIASGMATGEFLESLCEIEGLSEDAEYDGEVHNKAIDRIAEKISSTNCGFTGSSFLYRSDGKLASEADAECGPGRDNFCNMFTILNEAIGFKPGEGNEPHQNAFELYDKDFNGEAFWDELICKVRDKCGSFTEALLKTKPLMEQAHFGLLPNPIYQGIFRQSKDNYFSNSPLPQAIADCPIGSNPIPRIAERLGLTPDGRKIGEAEGKGPGQETQGQARQQAQRRKGR